MSIFKKIQCAALGALLICTFFLFGGCAAPAREAGGTLRVVCTIFPLYDWVRQITSGAAVDIQLLLDSGVDLHSYQPTANDIVAVSDCDVFLYVGGESDEWAGEVLQSVPATVTPVNLLEALGAQAKREETVEGMQEVGEDGEDAEYDEHIWLSLKNAQTLCSYIAAQLSALDAENAALYAQNAQEYTGALSALDAEYEAAVSAAAGNTLLFCDRFPFRYLTDDYGLAYYAAFSGCSAETEASFETITFLADKLDELGLHSVIILDGADGGLAKTVIENSTSAGVEILSLHSMQSVTAQDVSAGANYIDIMRQNLETLAAALN